MKQSITWQKFRNVLDDFKFVLREHSFTFRAAVVRKVFDSRHTAIILPTQFIKRIPASHSRFAKIRFVLKSGNQDKGLLSFNASGEFSHFTFGPEATRFIETFERFLSARKLSVSDVVVIKAFHSGKYYFRVKALRKPAEFFEPNGEAFTPITEKKILEDHAINIKLLAGAQEDYTKLKQAAKKEKINRLIQLKYL